MDFRKLEGYIDSLSGKGIPGCDCVVYIGHEPVFRRMQGFKNASGTSPVSDRDLYLMFSITKVLTCSAVMKLYEEGLLELDQPVSDQLPAYSSMKIRKDNEFFTAKTPVSIRHLMTMTAGLDYNIQSPSIKAVLESSGGKANTREVIDAIAMEPLSFEPGTHFQYSLCHDVLAAVTEAVSGMTFYKYLKKSFFDPLRMTNTFFHPADHDRARIADLYSYDPKNRKSIKIDTVNWFTPSPNYESGGAGLICSVDDYILFASALACGGVSADGTRLLSVKSIERMSRNELSGTCFTDFKNLGKTGYSYGLGVRTLVDPSSSKSPLGEFGWDGAAGSYVLIDPVNKLSIFYAQHVMNCGHAYSVIHPAIRDIVYECL